MKINCNHMKKWALLLVILSLSYLVTSAENDLSCKKNNKSDISLKEEKEVVDSENKEIFYADPTIFVDNGTYYLTGTRNTEPLGFAILKSKDLKEWSSPTKEELHMILEEGNNAYGDRGFWAPQILKLNKEYLFAYTANEQVVLAKSKKLLGPYTQEEMEPIDDSEKNIDPFIFKDDDGKYYLYHVRFDHGNYLWVAEFDIESGKIKPETLKKCFGQTEAWEATDNYPSAPIMEGPTVIKLENKYYLFYSANHFMNIDYSVGYATSDSPLGPWKKNQNSPIIHRSIVGENGAGHGDVFMGKDNQLYYVYHVHYSQDKVSPRRTRIVPLNKKWNAQTNTYDFYVDKDKVIVPVLSENK